VMSAMVCSEIVRMAHTCSCSNQRRQRVFWVGSASLLEGCGDLLNTLSQFQLAVVEVLLRLLLCHCLCTPLHQRTPRAQLKQPVLPVPGLVCHS
jgi:hypothetical protein